MEICTKKELIILSGKEVILEKGLLKTSVEDITKKAGVAKGSFYTYFKSKDDFILSLMKEKVSQYKYENKEIIEANLNLRDSLKIFSENVVKRLMRDVELFFLFDEICHNIQTLKKETQDFFLDIVQSRHKQIINILLKFSNEIDAENEEEVKKLAVNVRGIVDTFYEENFLWLKSSYKEKLDFHKSLTEKLNIDYEIEFMSKLLYKLIKK